MTTLAQLPESILVYWCAECRWFLPLDDGKVCPGEEHERSGLMRKRWGYICPDCPEEENFFLSAKNYREHNHLPWWESQELLQWQALKEVFWGRQKA